MPNAAWPELPYDAWKDTYATLHMWLQIAGKVALALSPPVNHSWGVALQVTSRGLATRLLPYRERALQVEFDFIAHDVAIRVTDGSSRTLKLAPKSVADFYQEFLKALRELGIEVKLWTLPAEVPDPVPFEQDTTHRSYDPEYAQRFWRILVNCHRVFTRARCDFIGKISPVHFFWGAMDLAVTRFSGRPAPPRQGPAFMSEAYSHEVISHGFWPGSPPVLEPAFYAYAVPEPQGLKQARVAPPQAYYHKDLGEFILPYEAVRTAVEPDATLLSFIQSTYAQAATLAGWDRERLERIAAAGS